VWQKETAPGTYTWQQALSYCENLILAGYNDWRLPNVNELQSLVDYTRYDPSIDTAHFPNTVLSMYWSSTTVAYYPSFAWIVDFGDGSMGSPWKSYFNHYVRAVRAGQCGSLTTTTTIISSTTTVETTTTTTFKTTTTTIPVLVTTTTTSVTPIQNHIMTKEPKKRDENPQADTECDVPTPNYVFNTNDEIACSWVLIDNISSGDEMRWKWYDSDLALYNETEFNFNFNGTGCAWHCIDIHGSPAENKPGDWYVDVYYNGIKQFTEHFSINIPPCAVEEIYGEHSEQTELLRYFRDNVLRATPEGQEIISLYYEWSPAIIKAMEEDEEFREWVKEMIDRLLPLIEGAVE
jgi:hypothetical protein